MASNDVLDAFFHPAVKISQETGESQMFSPSYKKGQAGKYSAIIRFIPNTTDPINKSVIKKNVAYLKNPMTNQSMYVDCPSSVGKPDPIVNTFFKLRNSKSPQDQENAKNFSRSQRYFSIVQIVQCASEPNLVGKFLIWNYGITVYKKVYEELNPSQNEYGIKNEATNPFDLVFGRPFYVECVEKGGYSNFDNCRFIEIKTPQDALNFSIKLPIKNADGSITQLPITQDLASNPKGAEIVVNFFKTEGNIPNLDKFEYKDWDADTQNFVASVINYYCGNNTQNGVYQTQQQYNVPNSNNGAEYGHSAPTTSQSTPIPNAGINVDDILSQISQNNGNATSKTTDPVAQPTPPTPIAQQPASSQTPLNIPGLSDVIGTPLPTTNQGTQTSSPTPLMGLDLDDIMANNF